MFLSRLTKKYQATIPQEVRKLLALEKGDSIVFEIQNGQVLLRKASPLDFEYMASLVGTLNEWSSQYDEEAYHDL